MRALILLLAAAFIVACFREPVAQGPTDNADIRVDRLFTHEGCTVYRFWDGGSSHYYAKCDSGTPSVVTERRGCGKNCSYEEGVPTVLSR